VRPSGVGFGVCAASRTRAGTQLLLGDWLSLSEFHRPASELGAASASTTHTFVHRFLWKTRALQAEHAELCAALFTAFSPKQETGFWAPLMGFFQRPPLRRHPSEAPASTEVVYEVPTSYADRPCRSSRLRRFALLRALRACCVPLPTMGFARFRACRRLPKQPYRQTLLSNAYPSELFPPLRAESRYPDITAWFTETRSPLTVVLCALPKECTELNLRGLTLVESVAALPCCHDWLARCSLGLLRLWALAHAPEVALRALSTTEVMKHPRCKHRS